MIKECAERLAGKRLFLAAITQCRFSAVLTPPVSAPSQHDTPLTDVNPPFTDTAYSMWFWGHILALILFCAKNLIIFAANFLIEQ